VSPRLGKGTLFKSIDKILPIPQHYQTGSPTAKTLFGSGRTVMPLQ
jgi:hypothetical protein